MVPVAEKELFVKPISSGVIKCTSARPNTTTVQMDMKFGLKQVFKIAIKFNFIFIYEKSQITYCLT